jgi:hypothetical protein
MNLMNKHGYNLHQQPPFSSGTMANINSTLNMEALICQNYLTNKDETYFTAFCTRISKFVDYKINYAFS